MPDRTETMKVWDPLVRIGHWLLVTAFFVAYFTEDELLTQHVWAGYAVAGVILFRVLWGFVGTKNARFTSFVRSPKVTARYLADIAKNRAQRHVGHNPAGGAMIVALLVFLAVTVFSGLEIYAIEENAGPLAGFVVADSDRDGEHEKRHDDAERIDAACRGRRVGQRHAPGKSGQINDQRAEARIVVFLATRSAPADTRPGREHPSP